MEISCPMLCKQLWTASPYHQIPSKLRQAGLHPEEGGYLEERHYASQVGIFAGLHPEEGGYLEERYYAREFGNNAVYLDRARFLI